MTFDGEPPLTRGDPGRRPAPPSPRRSRAGLLIGAAGQIAVAAERSLGLMRDIQDAVGRQTADSHRILGLLSEVEAMSLDTLASAASVEDTTAALETLAGSLEDEVGRFRVGAELQAT